MRILRGWEQILSLAEFAYNFSLNPNINTCPFEVVYGPKPYSVLDLTPLPLSKKTNAKAEDMETFMKELHAQIQARIEESNANHKSAVDVHKQKLLSRKEI